jgi:hypothetical protein
MNYRYEIRWTQRRIKSRQLLPRRVVAPSRQDAIRALAEALKDTAGRKGALPVRISITLGTRDHGPSRVEWQKQ